MKKKFLALVSRIRDELDEIQEIVTGHELDGNGIS